MQDDFAIYDYFPLIRLSDGQYPMYMPQVRASTTQTSFPMPIKAYMLEPFGYMPVYEGEYPQADVVTEDPPHLNEEDGKWYKTWVARDFTEEEIESNLRKKKEDLINQADYVLTEDIYNGITYTYQGTEYVVDVVPEKLTLLVCIKSLAKDSNDDATFDYSFKDRTVVVFSREEFLNMWKTVMESFYALNKKCWAFRETVNSITKIEDAPEVPTTFKEV